MNTIEQLREAVVERLGEVDLPLTVELSSTPLPLLDPGVDPLATPKVVVQCGARTYERVSRSDLMQRSRVVINVYGRVEVDAETGNTNKDAMDALTNLLTEIALKLAPSWMPLVGNDPPPEVRQFYDPDMLLQVGVLHGVVVVSFAEDCE